MLNHVNYHNDNVNNEKNELTHILINKTREEKEEEEVKIFFVPYTDAFAFADITEIINETISKTNESPFLRIEKVHIVHHKKLGIPMTYPYGICLQYSVKHQDIIKHMFRDKVFTIYHPNEFLYNKDVKLIDCEKYHTMDDLIRKKGI